MGRRFRLRYRRDSNEEGASHQYGNRNPITQTVHISPCIIERPVVKKRHPRACFLSR
jgi:hypothetical protein